MTPNRRTASLTRRLTALFILLGSFGALSGTLDRARAQSGGTPPRATVTTLGPVRASVSLAPDAPVIGDLLDLAIEVVAEPDVEVLMPAFGEALGRFVILDFSPREGKDEEGHTVLSQHYTLDVPMSGEWFIPPLVVEFIDRREGQKPAPDGEDAYELLTESIEFEVETVIPSAAEADLAPPLGDLPALASPYEQARSWIGRGLLVGALLIVLGFLLVRLHRRGRRRSAYDVAMARLRRLQKGARATPEEIDRFYVELSGIVRRYLELRFEIRAPECTTEEFLDLARASAALTEEHQELLDRFLHQADLVKFARTIPGDLEIAESVRSAERFLDETREDSPWLEATETTGVIP